MPELVDADARATLLLARQASLSALGRHDEALSVAEQVIQAPGADPGLVCFAFVYAGIQLRAEGDVDRALSFHERARQSLEGHHLPRLLAMNIACMGRLECDRRNLDAARELNQLATRMCDEMGDVWLSALGIANLAQLEQEMQSFARAEELFSRALSRLSAAHEAQYEGIYACRQGGLYLEWDRLGPARESLQRAQRLMARVNLPVQRAIVHACWALLEAECGDLDAAQAELSLARRLAERGATGVLGVMLELLEAAVELHQVAVHPAVVEHWRQRHAALHSGNAADARAASTNLDSRFALRMLARALKRHEPAVHVLRVGRDAAWFALDDAAKIDLARRGSLRRMLVALVDAQPSRRSLDGAALTSAGWPNERILADAAATRVRVAIATLRKLGLRDVLVTRDDGYRLDPDLRVERA